MTRKVTVDGVEFETGTDGKNAFYIRQEAEPMTLLNLDAEDLQWLADDINLNQAYWDSCEANVITAIRAKELEIAASVAGPESIKRSKPNDSEENEMSDKKTEKAVSPTTVTAVDALVSKTLDVSQGDTSNVGTAAIPSLIFSIEDKVLKVLMKTRHQVLMGIIDIKPDILEMLKKNEIPDNAVEMIRTAMAECIKNGQAIVPGTGQKITLSEAIANEQESSDVLELEGEVKEKAEAEINDAIKLLGLTEGVTYSEAELSVAHRDKYQEINSKISSVDGSSPVNVNVNAELQAVNKARDVLDAHYAPLREDPEVSAKRNLDALSAGVKTRTKDASRVNPNIHPKVSDTQKAFEAIQNDMNVVNKRVDALLKSPDAKKFWKTNERYKVAFPQEERDGLLKQMMVVPGEDGAEQSVELQHAPEYIKAKIKELSTPLRKQTSEYKDLVEMQKEVESLVKVIKDPRSTGEMITDGLLDTAKVVGLIGAGAIGLATGAAVVGAAVGAAGAVGGAAVGGAGAAGGAILGVAGAALGVAAGAAGIGLAVVVTYMALKGFEAMSKLAWNNVISPTVKAVVEGAKMLDAAQAKFRILTDIFPYEQYGDDDNLTKSECIELANKLEDALVFSEVFESLNPKNSLTTTHLKTIIDLRVRGGQIAAKHYKAGDVTAYEKDVIVPRMKSEMRVMLDREPKSGSESTVEHLSEANRNALKKLSVHTWSHFNNDLKAVQNELIECVRGQFKKGKAHHMDHVTYEDSVAVMKQASAAIHNSNSHIEKQLDKEKKAAVDVFAGDKKGFGLTDLYAADAAPIKQSELESQKDRLTKKLAELNAELKDIRAEDKEELIEDIKNLEQELEANAAELLKLVGEPSAAMPPVPEKASTLSSADEAAQVPLPEDKQQQTALGMAADAASQLYKGALGLFSSKPGEDAPQPVETVEKTASEVQELATTQQSMKEAIKAGNPEQPEMTAEQYDKAVAEADQVVVKADVVFRALNEKSSKQDILKATSNLEEALEHRKGLDDQNPNKKDLSI